MTEINVTSPTGLQELERFENKNFASNVWDKVISKIKTGQVHFKYDGDGENLKKFVNDNIDKEEHEDIL